MQNLSIVVRCFNRRNMVDDFLLNLRETLRNYEYEVVLVGGGDLDYENVVVTTEKDAIFDGLRNASGDLVCFIDVNLIDSLRFIPTMIGLIDEVDRDFDAAMTRKVKGNRFAGLKSKVSHKDFFENEFCLLKRNAVDAILSENAFSPDFLEREGFRIAWYEY
ncbi:hypothetical protein [Methanobrevibacter sp.]|uniref:hypothetical protein n=1 Tax=Methanobrevibacter sp. TaxID=66852 RepID=UPI0025E14DB8|nr:hypothetical protein [Methanobrevibacter sp.]MBQ2832693.1 hypothetical protein [Methanobrevibacter sp.]